MEFVLSGAIRDLNTPWIDSFVVGDSDRTAEDGVELLRIWSGGSEFCGYEGAACLEEGYRFVVYCHDVLKMGGFVLCIVLGVAIPISVGHRFDKQMNKARQTDENFMREAIDEALKADPELTDPNPRVGAVIVEDGVIVARGHHQQNGKAHAERKALANLGRRPAWGACMYVTLEPCSTAGRTGACTEAIRASGIARVVVGAMDPTPAHSGRGCEVLEASAIEVIDGILEEKCEKINPGFGGHETE